MKAEKNCCSLVHSIEQCLSGVISSYAYNEVIYPYNENIDEVIEEIIKEEITDEILPVRIYSTFLNNSMVFSALCGDGASKAAAEQVALMINCMLGLEMDKIMVKLGVCEKWDNVKTLLDSYGYGKFIAPEAVEIDGFVGVLKDSGKTVFNGMYKTVCGKECIYSKINLDILLDTLSFKAEPDSKLLPVTLVASDEPSLSFSVALGLRSQGLKVEEYTGNGSMIEAEEYADLKGITILLWVSGNTVMMKNLKSGERSETTVDKLLQNK